MTPADTAETATEAKLRLLEEEAEALHAMWAEQQRDELHAENAWLRHAEYDERAREGEQDRFDRSVYGY